MFEKHLIDILPEEDDIPSVSDNSVQEIDGDQPTDEELEALFAAMLEEEDDEDGVY